MRGWWQRLAGEKQERLSGAPRIRRTKTYSAESGYVYQYFYNGNRPVAGGRAYVFTVHAQKMAPFPLTVVLHESALRGRDLTEPHRYAIAKLSLFQAFDARERPELLREPVEPKANDIDEFIARLGID